MAEVIHAHVFETRHCPTFIDEIQYFNECLTFLFCSVCPNFFVLKGAIGFLPRETVQVFEAFIRSVGVTFNVVKQVARVWRGKQIEPAEIFEWKEEFGFWKRFGIEFAIYTSGVLQLRLSSKSVKRFVFNVGNNE